MQQQYIDLTFALAQPPREDLSGGWYRITEAKEKGTSKRVLELNHKHYAHMLDKIQAFPIQFKNLCVDALTLARKSTEQLPAMSPSIVLCNYYRPDSEGLYWHRDNSIQERKSAQKGTPVVSVSIGDSCTFEYKLEREDKEESVRLNSGDILIFGGPARLVWHSVTAILPNTCPKELRMPEKGRINLTYRSWD